jgi:hypothetical protein
MDVVYLKEKAHVKKKKEKKKRKKKRESVLVSAKLKTYNVKCIIYLTKGLTAC